MGQLGQEALVPQQIRANARDIPYSSLITSKYNQWPSKGGRANDTKMGQTQLSIKYQLLVNNLTCTTTTAYVVQNISVDKLQAALAWLTIHIMINHAN